MPSAGFIATVLTEPLEIIGLWLGTAGIFGGAAGSWSYVIYGTDAEIAAAAQRGAAAGFIVGSSLLSWLRYTLR